MTKHLPCERLCRILTPAMQFALIRLIGENRRQPRMLTLSGWFVRSAVRPPTNTRNRLAHSRFVRIQRTTRSKQEKESSQSREVASYFGDRSASIVGLHSLVLCSESAQASLPMVRPPGSGDTIRGQRVAGTGHGRTRRVPFQSCRGNMERARTWRGPQRLSPGTRGTGRQIFQN